MSLLAVRCFRPAIIKLPGFQGLSPAFAPDGWVSNTETQLEHRKVVSC
jgi:hypothetical protein